MGTNSASRFSSSGQRQKRGDALTASVKFRLHNNLAAIVIRMVRSSITNPSKDKILITTEALSRLQLILYHGTWGSDEIEKVRLDTLQEAAKQTCGQQWLCKGLALLQLFKKYFYINFGFSMHHFFIESPNTWNSDKKSVVLVLDCSSTIADTFDNLKTKSCQCLSSFGPPTASTKPRRRHVIWCNSTLSLAQ